MSGNIGMSGITAKPKDAITAVQWSQQHDMVAIQVDYRLQLHLAESKLLKFGMSPASAQVLYNQLGAVLHERSTTLAQAQIAERK